jgi:drug/metabolite transporter (DMT)-like permease
MNSASGYVLVSLACLASAIGIVLTKKIAKQTEETVITFYLGVASVICGLIGLFSTGQPSNPPVWEWFLSLGQLFLKGKKKNFCNSNSPSYIRRGSYL